MIEGLARFIVDLIAGPDGTGDQVVVEFFLKVIIWAVLLVVIFFGKDLLMRLSLARRVSNPVSASISASPFIQIIVGPEGERRYSFLYFKWSSKRNTYWLRGFQYDESGNPAVDFESQFVKLPDSLEEQIEYSWQATDLSNRHEFGGYTKMFLDITTLDTIPEGRGFFVTFNNEATRHNLNFVQLNRARLERMGADRAPRDFETRRNFILDYQAYLDGVIGGVAGSGVF